MRRFVLIPASEHVPADHRTPSPAADNLEYPRLTTSRVIGLTSRKNGAHVGAARADALGGRNASSRLVSSRLVSSSLLMFVACSRDEADSGEYGGSDGGGTTACNDEPGSFDSVLNWTKAANPSIAVDFPAVHVAHLPPQGPDRDPASARIFMMGGFQDQHLWDPLTGGFTSHVLTDNVNFFCAGHTVTPGGSLFVAGGGGGSSMNAINVSYRFDRAASVGLWQQRASMVNNRWYPTLTVLADGRVLAFGGEGGGANVGEIYDPSNNTWTSIPAPNLDPALNPPPYPFMFLLPDGNVFYAGGETQTNIGNARYGRVLVIGPGAPAWSSRVYEAEITGGSAVQYSPGRFMKSGGGDAATSQTQWIDMTGNYLSGDRSWVGLSGTQGDMLEPRHFHQLTLLPDGRVAATGGNWYGNAKSGDMSTNPCESPSGSGNLINQIPCSANANCPTGLCGPLVDHDGDRSTPTIRTCDPKNNQCYAQRSAEIWDPATKLWSPCADGDAGEESNPRMYHSTALLLRDGGVVSMGGGQRAGVIDQYNAQVYRPPYGAGTQPVLALPANSVSYGETFVVSVSGIAASEFNLLRLGSVTHSFNMDQRFVPIADFTSDGGNAYSLEAPSQAGTAPPGWYMLFALSNTGAISQGQYIEMNGRPPVEWVCAPGAGLTVRERGCLPSNGPTCGGSFTDVTLQPPSLGGSLRGWAVHTPAGAVVNPASPTASELGYINGLCQQACIREWENEPGVTATCTAANAFVAPTTRAPTGASTESTLIDLYAHGEGVFPTTTLGCELDSTCCAAFDEADCAAASDRKTPAGSVLGRGQAYAVSWNASASSLAIITNQGTTSRALSGSAGFSPCRDGNSSAACPFYLGSLTASTSSAMSPAATCSDGSTSSLSVSNVQIQLAQPAIGVARAATAERGFPAGGLVLVITATVGGQVYSRRQPTAKAVRGTQNAGALTLTNLDTTLVVPCGAGTTSVTARVNLSSSTVTGSPPSATITVPAQVTCGVSRSLIANVSDPNNDIVSTRWLVDGTLLASSVASVKFTGTHELTVRVRDARGATTTAKKVVSCT